MQLQVDLLQELKDVRKRGVGRLELPLPHVYVDTTNLEAAARTVPGYRDRLTRIAAIWLLLEHEIPRVSQPHRDWLEVMLALPVELRGQVTGELRKQVAKSIGEHKLNFK